MGIQDIKSFVVCDKCGKKLIERKKNGVWHFIFGKAPEGGSGFVPVEMFIQGNVKMRCLRRTCDHWITLNYFPAVLQSEGDSESDSAMGRNRSNKTG